MVLLKVQTEIVHNLTEAMALGAPSILVHVLPSGHEAVIPDLAKSPDSLFPTTMTTRSPAATKFPRNSDSTCTEFSEKG